MNQKLSTENVSIHNNGNASNSLPSEKKRILCVDDDTTILSLTKMLLEHIGYDVVASSSGADALEIFQSYGQKFDLVFTDFKMPAMNGIELSQKLVDKNPDIPIIIFTGSSELISEEVIKKIGIKGIISKPFSIRKSAEFIAEQIA